MGGAHVGQIDVMVAGMIPVANVEAKVRHAAVLVDEGMGTQYEYRSMPENYGLSGYPHVFMRKTITICASLYFARARSASKGLKFILVAVNGMRHPPSNEHPPATGRAFRPDISTKTNNLRCGHVHATPSPN
jgi:hypothetical protein